MPSVMTPLGAASPRGAHRLAGSQGFAQACRARNVGFFTVARSNALIHTAIFDLIGFEEFWVPAERQDGQRRPGAAVAELSELVDLTEWPVGTRLIVRREPLHPGAQHSLFPEPRVPLLGSLHRPGRRPGRAGQDHAGPRPSRTQHRAPEGHRALGLPLLRSRGEHELDGDRLDGGRPGALVPASLPRCELVQGPTQGPALGSFTPPVGWCARGEITSSVSSTVGPVLMHCSAPIEESISSSLLA
jgi:hypothetical protein